MVILFDRAIMGALIGKLGITLLVVVGLYLTIDLFESMRRFASLPGVDFALIAMWELLKLPAMFIQIGPLALLIAGVIGWNQLLASGELTAWRSGGTGLMRLTRPFVFMALALGALNVAISDWVMPVSDPLMRNISKVKFGEPLPDDVEGDWLRMPDGTIYQLHFPPQSPVPTALTRIVFDGQTQPKELIRAQIEVLTPDGVRLSQGTRLWHTNDGWQRRDLAGQVLPLPPSVRQSMERQFNPRRFSSSALAQMLWAGQLPESTLIQIQKSLWERGQTLLLPVALMLLVPLLGGLNPRAGGATWRVAAAIGAGFGLHVVEQVARRIAESGALHMGVAIVGPTLILGLLLGGLLRRRDARL
ncbi:MAG: hypothetical protein COX57_03360 [Alphaproteobacteria bacterium CG_4_10_14_0_2_um_filter_63_37]|nr:MAG: hypothetical protein AUJ55_05735 [Proteobacteria bacterium CG1_02_64_396]PJA25441.1 MAG: hypothetical protein COX57_03360 [Alphaproteobacteria bacterium CG_4_10_14_0_2_um_filter_63_37]